MNNTISRDDLLIIITTSPIKSHPSTQVIDMALQSIFKQPSLKQTPIIIVCDGYKIIQNRNQYKSGIISGQMINNYQNYKKNLKQKYKFNILITIQQRDDRYCFAQNIRFIMSKVDQPYVLIFQHDHVFMRQVDLYSSVQLLKHTNINYIGYRNKSVNKLQHKLDQKLQIRQYFKQKVGYVAEGTKHNHIQFLNKVKQYYINQYKLPLLPLFFWYDKVHVAKKQFYLNVIFNKKGFYHIKKKTFLKTQSFVQDSYGTAMRSNILLKPQLFQQLLAFILWDKQQQAVKHINGRSFLTEQGRYQNYLKNKDSSQSEQQNQQCYQIEDIFNA